MRNIIAILLLIGLNSCNGQDKNVPEKDLANLTTDIIPHSNPGDGIVYFSSDHGMTWKNTSAGLPEQINIGLGGIAVSASMIGLVSKENGVYLYDFKENKWASLPTDPQIIHSNPGGLSFYKDEICVGTQFGGIFSTKNKGITWASKNAGLGNLTIRKFAEINHRLYAGTNDGLYAFNEGLDKWELQYGQPSLQVNGITELDESIYIATNQGIFKSEPKSKNWKQVFPGHTLHNISAFDQTIYAMTYNELFSSTDQGNSWQSIQKGLPEQLYTFNVIKNQNVLFAGQWDGVYRKDVLNEDWKTSNTGLPNKFAATNLKSYKDILIIGCTESKLTATHKSNAQIDDYVVEVFEDTKANLWFGTMAKGAARYDGKLLTYFSTNEGVCDATVVSIAEDKEGNIWLGTHNGVSKYNGKTFTNFGGTEGLYGSGCNLLVDRKGNLWAGTTEGVFRFNGLAFSKFIVPNPMIEKLSYKMKAGKVWSLMEDTKGNIWLGRDGYGACKYDGTAFTHFTQKDGLCSNNVTSIVEDNQGNMWLGCLDSDIPERIKTGGVSRYDGKIFTNFPEIEGLSGNDIYTIYKDKKGNIWIGATRYGAYRYDGKKFMVFKETDRKDLTVNFGVQGILEDKNGTLWFGFSGGLFRFNGTSFVNTTQDGPWK